MFKFFALTFLALLVAAVHGAEDSHAAAGFLRRLDDSNSNDSCVALGATCDDDDDCCNARGVCTAKAYSAACRRFFRRGGQCDSNSQDGNDNACCKVKTVCKRCKARATQCVYDDDCCGDLDCVYKSRTAAFGTCRPDDSNDR